VIPVQFHTSFYLNQDPTTPKMPGPGQIMESVKSYFVRKETNASYLMEKDSGGF